MLREAASAAGAGDVAPLSFARRAEPAELPELMDEPCTYAELRGCLRDLAEVNRVTRGYAPTLKFLERVVERADRTRPLRILDVGAGGGDTLRVIARWAKNRGVAVELTGLDLNPHAARAAREFTGGDCAIEWVTANVFSYAPNAQPDVVLSALFTHHLSTAEVVRFLQWMEEHARVGWFVNDLERSKRAAFWFRFLPVIFGWHRFVQHDGPVSLRRAFVSREWEEMLSAAGVRDAVIEAHPMNRLCVSRVR